MAKLVERLTGDRMIAGSSLTAGESLCCVLELDTLSAQSSKTRPDLTEKLLTGM